MKKLTIPIEIPDDLPRLLNESEPELKSRFRFSIAIMLLYQGEITFGKAVQLSGLDRYSFEESLRRYKIPVDFIDEETVYKDLMKLRKYDS